MIRGLKELNNLCYAIFVVTTIATARVIGQDLPPTFYSCVLDRVGNSGFKDISAYVPTLVDQPRNYQPTVTMFSA